MSQSQVRAATKVIVDQRGIVSGFSSQINTLDHGISACVSASPFIPVFRSHQHFLEDIVHQNPSRQTSDRSHCILFIGSRSPGHHPLRSKSDTRFTRVIGPFVLFQMTSLARSPGGKHQLDRSELSLFDDCILIVGVGGDLRQWMTRNEPFLAPICCTDPEVYFLPV